MSYTTEELTNNVKDGIGKLLTEAAEYYRKGKDKAVWATIDYNPDTGRLMLVKWPRDNAINVCWSPAAAGYGDLGTSIGSVSTEYFGIDNMVELLVMILEKFM